MLRMGAVLQLRDQWTGPLRRASSANKGMEREMNGIVRSSGNAREANGRFVRGMGSGASEVGRHSSTMRRHIDGIGTSLMGGVAKVAKFEKSIVDGLGKRAKNAVSGLMTSLKISSALGTAALSAGVVAGVKGSVGLDAELRQSTALLRGGGSTSAEADVAYASMAELTRGLVGEVGVKQKEQAKVIYDIFSAGITDKDSVEGVLVPILKGAVAGRTDSSMAGNVLMKTLAAYGDIGKSSKEVTAAANRDMDVFFQTVNLGMLRFEDLAQNMGDVLSVASTARVPIEEVGAAIAQLTLNAGLVPAEAFTSLKNFINQIIAPGKDQKDAADLLFGKGGAKRFTRSLTDSGLTGPLSMLSDMLRPTAADFADMAKGGDAAEIVLKRLAGDKLGLIEQLFPDVRSLASALTLTKNGGDDFLGFMRKMYDAKGAHKIAFDEFSKSAEMSSNKFGAVVDSIRNDIFNNYLPVLTNASEGARNFLEDIRNSSDFKDASSLGKLKILGHAIATAIGNWWADNKEMISQKLGEGLDWLVETATPMILKVGAKLGTTLGQALIKGITGADATPAILGIGAAALAGPAILGTLGGAAGAAGGAGAGAAGAAGAGLAAPMLIGTLGGAAVGLEATRRVDKAKFAEMAKITAWNERATKAFQDNDIPAMRQISKEAANEENWKKRWFREVLPKIRRGEHKMDPEKDMVKNLAIILKANLRNERADMAAAGGGVDASMLSLLRDRKNLKPLLKEKGISGDQAKRIFDIISNTPIDFSRDAQGKVKPLTAAQETAFVSSVIERIGKQSRPSDQVAGFEFVNSLLDISEASAPPEVLARKDTMNAAAQARDVAARASAAAEAVRVANRKTAEVRVAKTNQDAWAKFSADSAAAQRKKEIDAKVPIKLTSPNSGVSNIGQATSRIEAASAAKETAASEAKAKKAQALVKKEYNARRKSALDDLTRTKSVREDLFVAKEVAKIAGSGGDKAAPGLARKIAADAKHRFSQDEAVRRLDAGGPPPLSATNPAPAAGGTTTITVPVSVTATLSNDLDVDKLGQALGNAVAKTVANSTPAKRR